MRDSLGHRTLHSSAWQHSVVSFPGLSNSKGSVSHRRRNACLKSNFVSCGRLCLVETLLSLLATMSYSLLDYYLVVLVSSLQRFTVVKIDPY